MNEFERQPVPANATKGFSSFLGMFAGEHVAATELLIGPLFITAGVSAFDLLVGLVIGNILAVLSWTLLTAPIAVKKRLTLYYQLEKIGGPGIIDVYNVASGVLWCCLAGVFIYVSATALYIPLDIPLPAKTDIWPTSVGLVLVSLGMGVVVTFVAVKGYNAVAKFANLAAPWMVVMFIVFGIASLPELGVTSLGSFWEVANAKVWQGVTKAGETHFTIWHVICFAWFGNMAWHVGMGDLTVFRYAKKARYGLASAAGMFLGHYIAWVAAGLLYAVWLQQGHGETITPGPLVFGLAGTTGLFLVLFAGWTTANPAIYRAGLAFQAIRPKWSRTKVTAVAGLLGTLVATIPGLASNFLNVAMFYGLVLMPMGAIIFVDHYLMKKMGLLEFYAEKAKKNFYLPPVLGWALSLLICLSLWWFKGVEIFFLALPAWPLAGLIYLLMSKSMQDKSLIAANQGATEVISAEATSSDAAEATATRAALPLGKVLVAVLGFASLATLLTFSVLTALGNVSQETNVQVMGITTVIWFLLVPLWMLRKQDF